MLPSKESPSVKEFLKVNILSSIVVYLVVSLVLLDVPGADLTSNIYNIGLGIVSFISIVIAILSIGILVLSDSKNPITHAIWTKLKLKIERDTDLARLIVLVVFLILVGKYFLFLAIMLAMCSGTLVSYFIDKYQTDIRNILK